MRRLLTLLSVLALSLAGMVVVNPAPASAYTSIADTTAADISVSPATCNGVPSVTLPCINNHPMRVRILRPQQTQPSGGWPLVVYLTDYGTDRCTDIDEFGSWLTRKQLADRGYVVLSVNQRGMPSPQWANISADYLGSRGCTAAEGEADGLNDSGFDAAGPTARSDVSGLIDWAIANYQPTGTDPCADPCINPDKVGVFGEGYSATLAWLMPYYDSDVKVAVPVATDHLVRNVAALSKDSSGAYRDLNMNLLGPNYSTLDTGGYGHADPSVFESFQALDRAEYLNPSYPAQNTTGAVSSSCTTPYETDPDCFVLSIDSSSSPKFRQEDVGAGIAIADAGPGGATLATTIDRYLSDTSVRLKVPAYAGSLSNKAIKWPIEAWVAKSFFDNRTVLDDDTAVDKIGWYNTNDKPIFIVHAFHDKTASVSPDVEAYTKMSGNPNRYLYLGACGNTTCGTDNATYLRDKVGLFLDKHLRLDAGAPSVSSTGGACSGSACVFYQQPPAPVSGVVPTTTWGAPAESTSWPVGTALTYCLGSDGYLAYTCGAVPTTADDPVVIKDTPNGATGWCEPFMNSPSTYATDERMVYTSGPVLTNPLKLFKVEASIWMSTSSLRLQSYVELWDVTTTGAPNYTPVSEVKISQGAAVHIPVTRNVSSTGTVVKSVFQPTGAAWTFPVGHLVRVKVASKQVANFMAEPLPADYTIYHSATYPSQLKYWLG